MAITQTGTTLEFAPGNANSGTVSSTITVPADAEFAVVGVSGFEPTVNFFSAGSMTLTKGGVDTAMTSATLNGDGIFDGSAFMAAIFYLALPDTGANKTLKWDWSGAGTTDFGPIIGLNFWKGVDTASPVRDADGKQNAGLPITTPTLTAVSDDLIIAFTGVFTNAEGAATTWSNLATLSQMTRGANGADGAWGTGSPSGDTTVGITGFTNETDGGIVAIVVKAGAAAATTVPMGQIILW